jgi:hypothetical protein
MHPRLTLKSRSCGTPVAKKGSTTWITQTHLEARKPSTRPRRSEGTTTRRRLHAFITLCFFFLLLLFPSPRREGFREHAAGCRRCRGGGPVCSAAMPVPWPAAGLAARQLLLREMATHPQQSSDTEKIKNKQEEGKKSSSLIPILDYLRVHATFMCTR